MGGGGRSQKPKPHIHIHIHTYRYTCIYPLIYTPLLNSRWLHNKALRYVRSVQLGAYMWRNWLKWVKMGLKWALLSRLSTPNGWASFLEQHIFDPFLTHCVSQNGAYSRLLGP